jgi:hypothetical protein
VPAGKSLKVRVKLSTAATRKLEARLRRGSRVRARITVVATDAAGNKATTTISVRVRR